MLTEAKELERTRFAKEVNRIVRANRKIFAAAESRAMKYVSELRSEVKRIMVEAEGFELLHLRGILRELDGLGTRWAGEFNVTLGNFQDETWAAAAKVAETSFASIGITLGLPLLPETLLIATKDYTAGLITGLSRDAIEAVSAEVRRGIIAGESIFKVSERLDDKVFLVKEEEGITWRAERIARTEMNRVHSLASHERMKQTREMIPDLRKEWRSARDGRVRETHAEADRRYSVGGTEGPIPVGERFQVGTDRLMMPGDPGGSPSEVIACRCEELPWREAWK